MPQKQKIYKDWSVKYLLTVSYILLVFLQCSSKFYSIANFYVLPAHSAMKANKQETHFHTDKVGTAQSLHLKLAKRYKDEHHPLIAIHSNYQNLAFDGVYIEAKKKFYSFARIYRGAYFHAPCLRGPPMA